MLTLRERVLLGVSMAWLNFRLRTCPKELLDGPREDSDKSLPVRIAAGEVGGIGRAAASLVNRFLRVGAQGTRVVHGARG
jgi:hypothetical protein